MAMINNIESGKKIKKGEGEKKRPWAKTQNLHLVILYCIFDAWDLKSHEALLGSSDNKDTRKDKKSIGFFTSYQRIQTNRRVSIGFLNTFQTAHDESSAFLDMKNPSSGAN